MGLLARVFKRGGDSGEASEERERARQVQERHERAQEKLHELEENPPERLEDWPDDEAKYYTYGGGDGVDHGSEDGPERQLGPSGVRHHEDGSVTIDGEPVDDPDEFKGDPIPGGPTDPDAPALAGEKDAASDEQSD